MVKNLTLKFSMDEIVSESKKKLNLFKNLNVGLL